MKASIVTDTASEFEGKLAELVRLWTDLEQTTLFKRFNFARALVELINEAEEKRMQLIAERLRVSTRTLYVFVSIGETIAEEEFQNLVDLLDGQGYGFTWTHLRSLARIGDRKVRNKLVKLWQSKSLGSTQFEELVRETLSHATAEANLKSLASVVSKKLRSISGMITWLEELRNQIDDLSLTTPADRKAAVLFVQQIGTLSRSLKESEKALKVAAKKNDSNLDWTDSYEDLSDVEIDDLTGEETDSEDNNRPALKLAGVKAPICGTGRRRKHGKPGSPAYEAHVAEKMSE